MNIRKRFWHHIRLRSHTPVRYCEESVSCSTSWTMILCAQDLKFSRTVSNSCSLLVLVLYIYTNGWRSSLGCHRATAPGNLMSTVLIGELVWGRNYWQSLELAPLCGEPNHSDQVMTDFLRWWCGVHRSRERGGIIIGRMRFVDPVGVFICHLCGDMNHFCLFSDIKEGGGDV